MTPKRIHILGTPIDDLTMLETLAIVEDAIKNNKQIHHTVVNAGKIVSMHGDPELRESVIHADIINADGQAVVWASKLFKKPLKERVAGIDLMEALVKLAYAKNYRLFFFGAKEEIINKLVTIYMQKYSPAIVAGFRNGYFKKDEETEIAKHIGSSGAHILFVAMSSPLKENFLYRNRDILKGLNFIMGVGGSFDVVAGYVKRAPLWMQKAGLEWLYRVYQEPKRMFKRYLVGNIRFIRLVIKYLFSKKKNRSSHVHENPVNP